MFLSNQFKYNASSGWYIVDVFLVTLTVMCSNLLKYFFLHTMQYFKSRSKPWTYLWFTFSVLKCNRMRCTYISALGVEVGLYKVHIQRIRPLLSSLNKKCCDKMLKRKETTLSSHFDDRSCNVYPYSSILKLCGAQNFFHITP